MDGYLKSLEASLEKIVLDPRYYDVLTLVKGIRNGVIYGTRVRFPHALVMIFLFRSGTLRQKITQVFKATRQHARNLGYFALVYKSSMIALRRLQGKEGHYDSFIAGLMGGYTVFARSIDSSVTQQIVIYVFARVMLASAKLLLQPADAGTVPGGGGGWGLIKDPVLRDKVRRSGWPVFASLSWATVMYIFRWHPEVVQSSLRSSMQYIYVNSDHWDSWQTFMIRAK